MNLPKDNGSFESQIGASTLRIFYGDLTAVAADVLVSSDDTSLTMSGGVSEALLRAGGQEIIKEAHKQIPLPLGAVAVTTAGRLNAKRLFHAVVLDRSDRGSTTKELIRRVVRECLRLCDERDLRSIAFPALATGTARLSPEASAMAMTVEIDHYLRRGTKIKSVSIALRGMQQHSSDVSDRFYVQVRQYLDIISEINEIGTLLEKSEQEQSKLSIGQQRRRLRQAQKQAARTRETLERDALLSDPGISGERWATRNVFQSIDELRSSLDAVPKPSDDPVKNVELEGSREKLEQMQAKLKPRPLVLSLHGIRTRGAWQKEITQPINKAGFDHSPLDYGWFGTIRLLLPWAREGRIIWFREKYYNITGNQIPSVIAHSLGSYIVANAMAKYDLKFDHVIFCGAIVPEDYDWPSLLNRGSVKRVLNDYGKMDFWSKMAPWAIRDAGQSGLVGFKKTASGRLINRTHESFQHSDYFYEGNYTKGWFPFLRGEAPEEPVNPEPPSPNWRFRLTLVFLGAAVLMGVIAWSSGLCTG